MNKHPPAPQSFQLFEGEYQSPTNVFRELITKVIRPLNTSKKLPTYRIVDK